MQASVRVIALWCAGLALAGTAQAQQMPESPSATVAEDVAAAPSVVTRATVRRPNGATLTYEIPSPKRGPPAPVIVSGMDVTRWGALDARRDLQVDPRSPGLSTVFPASGFDDNQTVAGGLTIPPDNDGAAGPNHVVNVINILIEWFDKSGNRQNRVSLRNFFTPTVPPPGYVAPATSLFDPKVVFDPWANRFVVVALDGAQSATNSRIYLAVSDDADPNGTWYYHFIPANLVIGGNNSWADFPGLGFDSDNIYVTNNLFSVAANAFQGVRLWTTPKAAWYAGGVPVTPAPADPITGTPGGPVATTSMPTLRYPPNAALGTRLVAYSGLSDGTNEYLQVINVTNPGATPTFDGAFIDLGDIEVASVGLPTAPQRDSGVLVATNDRRLSNHVVQFGDRLVAAATTRPVSGPDALQSTVRWWEIDVSAAPALVQTGTIGGEDLAAGAHTYFPSIFRNAAGDTVVGFAISAPRLNASSAYATRVASDPAGSTRPAALLAKGTDYYFRRFGGTTNRWGDYSGTALDPTDSSFWVYNQHAIGRGTITATGQDGRYGTTWGRVNATAAVPALYLGTATATEAPSNNTSFNGLFEPGETLDLVIPLRNTGTAPASTVSVTLSTSTPGVTIVGSPVRSYVDIPAASTGTPATPWQVQLAPGMPYGALIEFVVTVSSNAGTQALDLDFGVGPSSTTAQAPFVINEVLDTTPPAPNPGYAGNTDVTSAAGFRLNRDGVASTCANGKSTLGLAGAAGARRYDGYTFANPSNAPVCVSITHASTCTAAGQDQFSAVYFPAFDPANQITGWRADRGVVANSAGGTTFSVLVPARVAFTVVVSEVNAGGAAACGSYTLTVNGAVTAVVLPAPVVSSPTATAITGNSATLGGSVDSDSGSAILERGVVYAINSANPFPTRGVPGVVDLAATGTTGAFTVSAAGLNPGTTYAYRAYARNANGTTYTTPTTFATTSAATTTAIFSDNPDPSAVGQSYTVNVRVTGNTSPTGSVTIADGVGAGSVSCGPITLVAETATTSTASCALASVTAGNRILTANYVPTGAFSASIGTEPHSVTPAATTLSVSGPARARINTPATYTATLGVTPPGAGSPAGTVTIASGPVNCQFTVPTATPSCALTFPSVGSRTVSASFVPSNGDFQASASSGAGNAQTVVFSLSDIAVTKSDGVVAYRPGDLLVYTINVRNLGADAAAGVRVTDAIPAGLADVVWSCDANGGVVCPQSGGAGNIDALVPSFPAGALLGYTLYGNVLDSAPQVVNTAAVVLPADTTVDDPVPGNNSASDTDLLDFLLRTGFENAVVSASSGAQRLALVLLGRTATSDETQLLMVLDDARGEAARVYARRFDERTQVALATRAPNGALRLGPWQDIAGEPEVAWTARAVADGWVLDSLTLR